MRLIEAVKHSRCLYDSTDRQYRSTEYKIKTSVAIFIFVVPLLSFLRSPKCVGGGFCYRYGKEKRKVKYQGDQSTWQYFKHLSFLDPHMIDRTAIESPARKEHPDQITVTDPSFGTNLIEEVRGHPCLFDIRDPKYRHSECRNQAWNSVIAHLNYPGDVNSIYKQWKKIRDRYVREKRRLRMQRDNGVHDDSTWDLYPAMSWIDPFLDERAQLLRHVKRKHDEELSDYGYMVAEKGRTGADVLLDGDSAFAASAVSDLRTLPEHARALAKVGLRWLTQCYTSY
uniref:MADF domain-containing protein n=1 Tax=Angiostrongylus cantonensis TaxID=6313 RepID=A0A0K0DM28_ANGCA